MLKVVLVEKEKDGRKFNNYYIGIPRADGTLTLIPIDVKWFNPKQHYIDEKHLLEVAEKYQKEEENKTGLR